MNRKISSVAVQNIQHDYNRKVGELCSRKVSKVSTEEQNKWNIARIE